ncbi:MAG: hypothetical protein ABSB95_12930 [Dissulfurispiraceae bacterium]|jgi:hypothetical protein
MKTINNMKFILLLLLVVPYCAFAGEHVQGHACYTYGDNESRVAAKQTVVELAKRNAIESYLTYIQSSSLVTNGELTKDTVASLSAATALKNMKIIDDQEKGRELCVTIEGMVEPSDIKELIAAKQSETEKMERVDKFGANIDWVKNVVTVKGTGAANTDLPRALWKKSAEDAAIMDAQAKLLEMVQGLKMYSKTFLSKYRVQSDEKIKEIAGMLQFATQVGRTVFTEEDTGLLAEVTMEVSMGNIK